MGRVNIVLGGKIIGKGENVYQQSSGKASHEERIQNETN